MGALRRADARQEATPIIQAERADPTLVGQLRRLAAQLQQAADQLERLGTVLRAAEIGSGTPPMDERQLVSMLLANQQPAPRPQQGSRYGRFVEVAGELERLAGMLRAAEGGAPGAGAADDQQLLNLLLAAQRTPQASAEAQRYARLLELLSSLGGR